MVVFKYSLFAVVSTIINLLVQFLALLLYSAELSLYLAMFVGTSAGLVAKYILDKKYVFHHVTKGKKDDVKKFILYSFFGIFTTSIFWGMEIAFDIIFQHSSAKFLGATLGLSIGYIIKYFLDKKYVFQG
ncbi:MAG TPA: GtrA family protein [bacterium]|nr:GtrA family protein [bacterium]